MKKYEKILKKYYHIVHNHGIIKKKWNTAQILQRKWYTKERRKAQFLHENYQ